MHFCALDLQLEEGNVNRSGVRRGRRCAEEHLWLDLETMEHAVDDGVLRARVQLC